MGVKVSDDKKSSNINLTVTVIVDYANSPKLNEKDWIFLTDTVSWMISRSVDVVVNFHAHTPKAGTVDIHKKMCCVFTTSDAYVIKNLKEKLRQIASEYNTHIGWVVSTISYIGEQK